LKESNSHILTRLRENPNETLVHLYKNYRKEFLSWSFKNYGINEHDALDCFQDAVIVFYRNVTEGKVDELTSSDKTYLFGIAKNFLLRKTTKNRKEVPMKITEHEYESALPELFDGTPIANRVADMVKTMSDPCKSILRYFYFRGLSMDEIAEKMNYKNGQTVKAQKVRCIREIQRMLEASTIRY